MGITTDYLSNFLIELTKKSTQKSSLYLFLSKTHDNIDELVVEQANSSNYQKSIFDPLKEMVYGRRITENDISSVIDRYDWTTGTVYQEWSSSSNTVFYEIPGGDIDPFYIYTSSGNVYKCLDNNENAQSIVEPSHVDLTPREESDGYVWKYMYTVPPASKFITSDYIPVFSNTAVRVAANTGIDKIFVNNSGNTYVEVANGTVQSFVNSTVFIIEADELFYANGTSFIPADDFYNGTSILLYETGSRANGSLFTIDDYNSTIQSISLTGTGYGAFSSSTKYEITPRVRIAGDGIGATAILNINPVTKSISSVEIKDSGVGYSFANCIISANVGVGGDVVAVIDPQLGHGFKPAVELGSDKLMFSIGLVGNESNTVNADLQNGFRTAGIILNPAPANTAFNGTVTTTIDQTLVVGTQTELDTVFTVPSLDTVAGLSVAAVNTAILSNTSQSNTAKANTLVELINEFNKNIGSQPATLPSIVIQGKEYDEVHEVLTVSSNTLLNMKDPALASHVNVPYYELYQSNTFDQTQTLVVDQADVFSNGEVLIADNFDLYGTLVTQSGNNLIVVGTTFPTGTTISGKVSGSTASVVNSTPSSTSINPNYSQVLYLNNILKISKTPTSNADFKIVVKV